MMSPSKDHPDFVLYSSCLDLDKNCVTVSLITALICLWPSAPSSEVSTEVNCSDEGTCGSDVYSNPNRGLWLTQTGLWI